MKTSKTFVVLNLQLHRRSSHYSKPSSGTTISNVGLLSSGYQAAVQMLRNSYIANEAILVVFNYMNVVPFLVRRNTSDCLKNIKLLIERVFVSRTKCFLYDNEEIKVSNSCNRVISETTHGRPRSILWWFP